MKGYEANGSLVNRVNMYIRNITNDPTTIDPTTINPTINIIKEKNYHSTLSGRVKIGLVTIIAVATLATGCFTTPAEEYGLTKPVSKFPANKQVFTTEQNKKKIDFKWEESVSYQILEDKGDVKDIEYILRIDNNSNMLSPEHIIPTNGLEKTVEVDKGVNHWQVSARYVDGNGEKCFTTPDPEQIYTDEEVFSETWEFDIQKIVIQDIPPYIPPDILPYIPPYIPPDIPPDIPQDTDGDGVPDNVDNCPNIHNPYQYDWDNDGTGTACDSDEMPGPPVFKFARFMEDYYDFNILTADSGINITKDYIDITENYENIGNLIPGKDIDEIFKEYQQWEKKTSNSKKTSMNPGLLEKKIAKLSNTRNWKASIASNQKGGGRGHNSWARA